MRWAICFLLAILIRTASAETEPFVVVELPLRVREGLLWMQVHVPQSDKPLNFLLDSGASASVINLSTAHRLGLTLGTKVKVAGVQSSVTGYWPVKLSPKANQLDLPSEYLALDLSELSGACSCSVDGLVGGDFFKGRVVEIDYAAEKLRVLEDSPSAGTNAMPLDIRSGSFGVTVSVNGISNQWVRVDTGCASGLQWVTSKRRAKRSPVSPAVGLAQLSIPQTMTEVQIGSRFLDMVPTGLHRKAIFPDESGLLGNGVLAQFGVITIDAKLGRLVLGRSAAK